MANPFSYTSSSPNELARTLAISLLKNINTIMPILLQPNLSIAPLSGTHQGTVCQPLSSWAIEYIYIYIVKTLFGFKLK